MNNQEREFPPEAAAEREQFIISQFERANFDIRDYPKLFERFKRLHHPPESTHFEDAAQMVDIIEALWPKLEVVFPSKLNKEKLSQATLLHDIGKSGPKEATPDEQELIVSLFNPHHYPAITPEGKKITDAPISQAIDASDFDRDTQQKITDYLKKLNVNIKTETMIDLWRKHAEWTWDILKASEDDKIDIQLAAMAASHHILDGKNPAGLDPEKIPQEAKTIEIIETYEVLILVDKFQAFVKRSGLSHTEAIKALRGIIDRQKLPERVKNDYRKILEVIETSGEKIIAKLKS